MMFLEKKTHWILLTKLSAHVVAKSMYVWVYIYIYIEVEVSAYVVDGDPRLGDVYELRAVVDQSKLEEAKLNW